MPFAKEQVERKMGLSNHHRIEIGLLLDLSVSAGTLDSVAPVRFGSHQLHTLQDGRHIGSLSSSVVENLKARIVHQSFVICAHILKDLRFGGKIAYFTVSGFVQSTASPATTTTSSGLTW